MMFSIRQIKPEYIYAAIFVLSLFSMGVALIMQYVFSMEPCPLCILQRITVSTIGILALVGWFLHSKRIFSILISSLIGITSILGILISGRHVWLQHLPKDQIPGCLPGMGYLLETFSVIEVVAKILKGSEDCANVEWTFLGLSIPNQVLLLFIVLLAMSVFNFYINLIRKREQKSGEAIDQDTSSEIERER